jgi:antitoxin (DNA-binding transcriptional repressor) of toxin-antitoxin stability system
MKITTIRQLKHETSRVLSWVADGETVEVRRRNEPVAVLSPPVPRARPARPDLAARLRAIYGRRALRTTGTALMAATRGER